MKLVALLAGCAALALSACASVGTSYLPNQVAYEHGAPPLTDRAVRVYEGDLRTLIVSPDSVVLGTMTGGGNAFSGQGDVREQVEKDAAKWGATHIILARAETVTTEAPSTAHTNCESVGTQTDCTTVQQPGATFYKPFARYLLVRVPAEQWGKLPVALRPLPPAPPAPAPLARTEEPMQAQVDFGRDR